MISFDSLFDRLIDVEKGFTDNRADPGNWTGGRTGAGELKGTKYGIAANTYPDLDIRNLTLEDCKKLYFRDWWIKLNADQLPPALVAQLWDFAINAGMGTSRRALQAALGVAQDGVIGPLTVAAAAHADLNGLLLRFNAARLRYYTSLSKWPDFGKGWANRVAGQLDFAAQDIA